MSRQASAGDLEEPLGRRIAGPTDDRHLDDRPRREVEGNEPLAEERRVVGRDLDDRAQGPLGGLAIAVLAGQGGKVEAIAPPDGSALSCRSFGRVMSDSASSAVSKKPPAGSVKRSRI